MEDETKWGRRACTTRTRLTGQTTRLMLNFYGLKLVDVRTGDVARTDEWEARYHNMNILTHNNLRISTKLVHSVVSRRSLFLTSSRT